ncbi:MAG TPA: hypothetical protein VGI86_13330 [Acidimicrobiia bacterium]|jgi:hypothetical protein
MGDPRPLAPRRTVMIAFAVLRRPRLWPTALATLGAASPPGWWRRPPYVPRPDREYLDWRLHTAYGDDGVPTAADVVDYLEWVRVARRGARHHRFGRHR